MCNTQSEENKEPETYNLEGFSINAWFVLRIVFNLFKTDKVALNNFVELMNRVDLCRV